MARGLTIALVLAGALHAFPSSAGEADVIGATVDRRSAGLYDFDVTIRSRDTGWDRYADRFEVLAPDGRVLGVRVLDHPHENEQPFTRELSAVAIPRGIDRVTIRARFKPVGYDGGTLTIALPTR